MSETKSTPATSEIKKTTRNSGFFGRLLDRLDSSMKQKAQEKSQQSDCCSGSDKKGGKCC